MSYKLNERVSHPVSAVHSPFMAVHYAAAGTITGAREEHAGPAL